MHVDEQSNPNRKVRPPPPFCYHPELYPERAKFNPLPTNFLIKNNKKEDS